MKINGWTTNTILARALERVENGGNVLEVRILKVPIDWDGQRTVLLTGTDAELYLSQNE